MVDVLNLEIESYPCRDIDMTTLVCNYLRYNGFSVMRGCIFEGKTLIFRHKPKLVYLSNGIGDSIKHEIVKFAKKIGCLVVTGVSEGNILPSDVEQKFWGWNKDEIMYEDLNLQWSHRARNLVIEKFPEYKNRIKVSGAIGFDFYKILQNKAFRKEFFKKKYHIPQNMPVVGFACFNFGNFYKEETIGYPVIQRFYSKNQIERFKRDGNELNDILRILINKNPQIFFLIKEHPNSKLGDLASAIFGLREYKNVLVLKSEESIANCINVSDIWLAYESTSILEAWLSDLNTILINPSGSDFPRYSFYNGSLVATTVEGVKIYLDEFFSSGKIDEFEKKQDVRTFEIEKVIQWNDGLNHKRAGDYIIELLKSNENNRIKNSIYAYTELLKEFLNMRTHIGIWYRGINKNRQKHIKNFNLSELTKYEETINEQQIKLYN